MARAYQSAFAWSTTHGRSLIAACVDSERHEVGLRMLCDLLDLARLDARRLDLDIRPVDLGR